MEIGSRWKELAAQQLVRYEALFNLLGDIQGVDSTALISARVATQWKYFANVCAWRLVVFNENGNHVIDGFRSEAHVATQVALSPWDAHYRSLQRPCSIRMGHRFDGPMPPDHLSGKRTCEIRVLPFTREDRCIALLSVSSRHEPFNELDMKFIRIFGAHFADRITDILLRRQATEALIQKATRDALTGLYNRGTIIERLKERLILSKRTGQPVSVILADIDFFKIINDRHGHLSGDEVLREVSYRLQTQLRDSDALGRYGGEEFLFVLFPCDANAIETTAERFRHAVDAEPVIVPGGEKKKIDVTISLGASSNEGQLGKNIDAFLKQADDALYCSKANGRNCVTFWSADGGQ